MRTFFRLVVLVAFCLVAAGGAVGALLWSVGSQDRYNRRQWSGFGAGARPKHDTATSGNELAHKRSSEPEIDPDRFEDGGFGMAVHYMAPLKDPSSLAELREATGARGQRGITALRAELEQAPPGSTESIEDVVHRAQLHQSIGLLSLYEGRFDEAADCFDRAFAMGGKLEITSNEVLNMLALAGIASLRRGEIDNCINCLGPSSCIFPIALEAVHTRPSGSRAAIDRFSPYLAERPGDLRIRWLLNIAYMTLGEYPAGVPPAQLIPLDTFRSKIDVGRFANVAPSVGLTSRGPNQAGGSIFDDFNGDGLPDIFTTSLDAALGASLFVNHGDGTFEDRSNSAGLIDQVFALNASHADFDNDGDLDVVMLRGAWEGPHRMTLLRNRGDGRFEDVTLAAGLATPLSSIAAVWGDYDNDGFVDLYVCGEYLSPFAGAGFGAEGGMTPDPRNRSRLYRNRGNGTFEDVAERAGVTNERCAKGAAWGDYDSDGRPDLFVSNMGQACRLYRNEGGGKFRDVAEQLGVAVDRASFACWFWDFDNDGKLDLYVNENRTTLAVTAAVALGIKVENASRPCLFRNVGSKGFVDVARDVGLDRPMAPMGCNFGDIDNDGYLDFYLGTGWISASSLVPNLLFKNVDGDHFEDVTLSSGTGHLQKGHGVSFADLDSDGDLDLFVQTGGPSPGDRAHNLLFQNPGHGHNSLKVKLVGTRSNRSAFGARIESTVIEPGKHGRSIFRTVGNNSSFGGNTLVQSIGLGDASEVAVLEVSWPASETKQRFYHIPGGQTIVISEGSQTWKTMDRRPAIGRQPSSPGHEVH
jgi:hypothetical protein